jgi:hypothetical protein
LLDVFNEIECAETGSENNEAGKRHARIGGIMEHWSNGRMDYGEY